MIDGIPQRVGELPYRTGELYLSVGIVAVVILVTLALILRWGFKRRSEACNT